MSHLLIEGRTPLDMDILQHYSIPVSEIQKGVQCPSCRSLPMIRQSKKWYCASCQTLSKTAHIEAIHDFLLLIDPNVSNQRCRDFLLLDSKDIAYRLLSHMKLPCKGTGKARIYHRPK